MGRPRPVLACAIVRIVHPIEGSVSAVAREERASQEEREVAAWDSDIRSRARAAVAELTNGVDEDRNRVRLGQETAGSC